LRFKEDEEFSQFLKKVKKKKLLLEKGILNLFFSKAVIAQFGPPNFEGKKKKHFFFPLLFTGTTKKKKKKMIFPQVLFSP